MRVRDILLLLWRALPQLPRTAAVAPIGIGVPIFLALVFVFTPQMSEMLTALEARHNEDGIHISILGPLGFGLAAIILAASAWYWSRAAVMAYNGLPDRAVGAERLASGYARTPTSADILYPRIAYVIALLICLAPFVRGFFSGVDWYVKIDGVIAFFLGAAILILLIKRRRLKWTARANPPAVFWRCHTTAILAAAPFGAWIAGGLLVINVAVVVFCATDWGQAMIERVLHTPTAAMLALAFAIAPLTFALEALRDVFTIVARLLDGAIHRGLRRGPKTPSTPLILTVLTAPNGRRDERVKVGAFLGIIAFAGFILFGSYTNQSGVFEIQLDWKAGRDARPELRQALTEWARARVPADRKIAALPAIIVAAEGGASRASAHLLASMRLADSVSEGAFGQRLFAISAVSGGSHGAVAYALAAAQPAYQASGAPGGLDWATSATASKDCSPLRPRQGSDQPRPRLDAALTELAQGDLLAATIANFFLIDTIRPFYGFLLQFAPDRGVRLGDAFQRHWRWCLGLAASAESTNFGLAELSAHLGSRGPHLLLNGTDVVQGGRVIASTIKFDSAAGLFAGADDLLTIARAPESAVDAASGKRVKCLIEKGSDGPLECAADMSLGNAVMASARFPIISPAGRFQDSNDAPRQIVDGGYFENYGARTALELARAIESLQAEGRSLAEGLPKIVPVVVVISNDGFGLRGTESEETDSARSETFPKLEDVTVNCEWSPTNRPNMDRASAVIRARDGYAAEVVAPLKAVAAIRAGHGFVALRELRRELCPPPPPAVNRAGDGPSQTASTAQAADATPKGDDKSKPPQRMHHFAMPAPLTRTEDGDEAAPLNWALNIRARKFLLDVVPSLPFNQRTAVALSKAIEQIESGHPISAYRKANQ